MRGLFAAVRSFEAEKRCRARQQIGFIQRFEQIASRSQGPDPRGSAGSSWPGDDDDRPGKPVCVKRLSTSNPFTPAGAKSLRDMMRRSVQAERSSSPVRKFPPGNRES